MSNVDCGGSINNDKFLRAMLIQRNTPDADCKLSPSQVLFGHPLRDTLSFSKNLRKYSRCKISKQWREAWKLKEEALRTRYVRNTESTAKRKALPPLSVGDRCFIQNQHGNHPKRWHSSGKIMEVLPFDQYAVKVDGSRKLTTRNRRFLRFFRPISTSVTCTPSPYDEVYTSEPIKTDPVCTRSGITGGQVHLASAPDRHPSETHVEDSNEKDDVNDESVDDNQDVHGGDEEFKSRVTASPDAQRRTPLALRRLYSRVLILPRCFELHG